MQTKKPTTTKRTTSKTSEGIEEGPLNIEGLPLDAQIAILDEQADYESLEDDTVRVYVTKNEIVPGVSVDRKIFRVYLTQSQETYLQFREPNTKECLDVAEAGAKGNRSIGTKANSNQEKYLEFISTLSCGPIEASHSLLTRLPVNFQYKIVRTIEYITESKGFKLMG